MRALFKYQILQTVRDKVMLFWTLGFSLVLALIFAAMFSGLDTAYEITPVRLGIVENEAYEAQPQLAKFIDEISDANANEHYIEATPFATEQAATQAANNNELDGFLKVDPEGTLEYHIVKAQNARVNTTIVKNILNAYLQTSVVYETIFAQKPELLVDYGVLDEQALENMTSNPGVSNGEVESTVLDNFESANLNAAVFERGHVSTEEMSVTKNPPDTSARYYFALLAFASSMGMTVSMAAIQRIQAQGSRLGARRAVAGMPRWRVLVATLLASWVCVLCCLLIVYYFIAYGIGVNFGGNGFLCHVALAASSLMACTAGALLGTFGRMPLGVVSGITCLLSLFTGLYGTPSQALADTLENTVPLLAAANPLWQSTHSFFSLLYYDTLEPFFTNCGTILIMAAVFLAIAIVRMRRTSYEHI